MSRSAELHAIGVICSYVLCLTDKSSMIKSSIWQLFLLWPPLQRSEMQVSFDGEEIAKFENF